MPVAATAKADRHDGVPTSELSELISRLFPPRLRSAISSLPAFILKDVVEVRLRLRRPVMVITPGGDWMVAPGGGVSSNPERAEVATDEDLEQTLNLVSRSSLYALEDEMRQGYITVPGGHRIGLAGRTLVENGEVRTIRPVSGLNIRFSREVPGCASPLLPVVIEPSRTTVRNTLVFSPPGCGKTTILRDLIRQVSNGVPEMGFRGLKVGLVDERSEIAGSYQGLPQKDVGLRTDILDACPKARGMMLLLRALSPDVIATDELGRPEDAGAVREAINSGVKIFATAHASTLEELRTRPVMARLLGDRVFSRLILLGSSRGVGTVERVYDGRTFQEMSFPEGRQC